MYLHVVTHLLLVYFIDVMVKRKRVDEAQWYGGIRQDASTSAQTRRVEVGATDALCPFPLNYHHPYCILSLLSAYPLSYPLGCF